MRPQLLNYTENFVPMLRSLFLIPVSMILSSQFAIAMIEISAGDPLVIDVLLIDRGLFQGGDRDRLLSADPSISVRGIPMPGHYSIAFFNRDAHYMNRVMRLYMPRSYQKMRDIGDMILLAEAACGSTSFHDVYFDAKWMVWFVRAVQEDGVPLSMWGGDASWGGGGAGDYKSWGDTILDEILPFQSLGGYSPDLAAFHYPHFLDPEHELARLPWKSAGPVELLNTVRSKPGSTLVAEAIIGDTRYPWIAWWESGKGKVVGEAQVFGSMGTSNRMAQEWKFYQDFVIYMVYFSIGKPIPNDVERAHRIREEINTHIYKASLLISLLEFIEKFGASTVELYEELGKINRMELTAEEYIRMDDYDSAADVFDEIHQAWMVLNAHAIKVKDRALFWIYVSEWLVTTSAALISGVVLWWLMVRRRLYREVTTTQLRHL
jgi:hypothetical protein